MRLPLPYKNVMITYIGTARVPDKYYDRYEKMEVKRLAFLSDSDGYYDRNDKWVDTPNGVFHVPQYWKPFTHYDGSVTLSPSTFYSFGKVRPEDVIEWEYHDGITEIVNH